MNSHERPTQQDPSAAPRFWRTLEERAETSSAQAAAEDEFLPETVDDSLPATTLTRRGFLGFVGAATAVATAACTPRDRTIVPYTKRPEEIIPGVANYYATTFSEGEVSYSVLVKTREGRPIHITGNDEDPRLRGKTSTRAIADVMGLYDPDRLRGPLFEQRPTSWQEAQKALLQAFAEAQKQSKPVLLLTSASNSPTRKALLTELRTRLPTLEHHAWEPAYGDAARVAAESVFGAPVRSRLRLDRARVILALGSDFLSGDDPEAIAAFTSQRRPDELVADMNRLWVIEGPLTLTGANADHRFAIRPSRTAGLAFALATELRARHGVPLPGGVILPPIPKDYAVGQGIPQALWEKLASDLATAGAKAVVLCGDGMPTDAQVAAHLLNAMLGTLGRELSVSERLLSSRDFETIIKDMDAGRYHAAVLWGVNPAYAIADSERFRAALAKVPHRFSIGQAVDETAALCQWNFAENHWLESWGDYGSPELLTLQQPALRTLYDSRQGEEIILAALKNLGVPGLTDYHDFLLGRWRREVYGVDAPVPFERFLNSAKHDGVLRRDVAPAPPLELRPQGIADAARAAFESGARDEFELVLSPSTQLHDGRYANNPWLQELPDPITKNTWGNPLLIAVADAAQLGLANGDVVALAVGDTRVETPVLVQPGQAPCVLALALGYGRKAGSVARNVGVNAFPLLGGDIASPNLRSGARLSKTGRRVRLALTQSHHRMHGRDLVRNFTLAEFADEVSKPRRKIALTTLYPDQQFPDHKWGMVIDLAACVGCSACVIACQSENNIATVGAEQVERGREMHWMRIDTYYEGSEANPKVVHQPMLCQHCDSAPCENVCPVNATNHSPDGLNQMAYNRCVGTRYCANNCPYKVRRYNFFNYTSDKTEPASLVFNPEVTVRPRGVMEKCTFCVQRIEDGRMRAKAEKRSLRDGEIEPACAAACPSSAIVFGDLKDAKSRVARASSNQRGYKVLEEVGARPAVTYLAGLRNPVKHEGSHG